MYLKMLSVDRCPSKAIVVPVHDLQPKTLYMWTEPERVEIIVDGILTSGQSLLVVICVL